MPAKRALAESSQGRVDGEVQRVLDVGREYPSLLAVQPPINYIEPAVFVKRAEFAVMGWSSLAPFSIGIVRGVGSSERGTRGMPRVEAVTSIDQLMEILANDRIDVAVSDRFSGRLVIRRHHLETRIRTLEPVLEHIPLYHFLNERWRELVPRVGGIVQAMAASGDLERVREEVTTRMTLPHWPNAYPASGASATLKLLNEDFVVTELPLQLPCGEGEHVWLDIEKNGANTAFVALQLAAAAGVQERDVGYAGLKDRHAITRQWFSIHLPKGEAPDLTLLQHPEFKVLGQSRHLKKLRPGDLRGNRFRIVLRDVTGDRDAIEANLAAVASLGVPNYFGAQRFGHDGGNVEQGRAMAKVTSSRPAAHPWR